MHCLSISSDFLPVRVETCTFNPLDFIFLLRRWINDSQNGSNWLSMYLSETLYLIVHDLRVNSLYLSLSVKYRVHFSFSSFLILVTTASTSCTKSWANLGKSSSSRSISSFLFMLVHFKCQYDSF